MIKTWEHKSRFSSRWLSWETLIKVWLGVDLRGEVFLSCLSTSVFTFPFVHCLIIFKPTSQFQSNMTGQGLKYIRHKAKQWLSRKGSQLSTAMKGEAVISQLSIQSVSRRRCPLSNSKSLRCSWPGHDSSELGKVQIKLEEQSVHWGTGRTGTGVRKTSSPPLASQGKAELTSSAAQIIICLFFSLFFFFF